MSGTPQGSTISVLVHSYDVPNRFTIKDASGVVLAYTSWMGYATYAGPWGPSLNTSQTQTMTFALGVSTSVILKVETSTSTYSDYWDASISCTPPVTNTYAGVTVTYEPLNNILRFNSISDINTVIDQLDADYETYNDNYESQYPNYTASQLDSMDIINNFDEFKKLKDFESLFPGYASIRKQIENTENTWLNNNMTGTDPDDIDFTFDDAENTIFNSNYSVKVGNDTYQFTSNGIYKNGVLSLAKTTAEACVSNRKNKQRFTYGTDREFKLKVAVDYSVWRTGAKGKVVSFKKKSGGGWKRSRIDMAVGCSGNLYTGVGTDPCFLLKPNLYRRSPSSGYKKKKSLKTIEHMAGPGALKTKTQQFYSFYQLSDGTYNSLMIF